MVIKILENFMVNVGFAFYRLFSNLKYFLLYFKY